MLQKGLAITALAFLLAGCGDGAREQIRIVGSSTVFPFSTAVAEMFGRTTQFRTPIVEATGSGGGIKLFCNGIGLRHPDIANASRRMKKTEFEMCQANGVRAITEVMMGYDGIVLANDKSAQRYSLSKQQVFLALAKRVPVNGELVDNPYTHWNQIDPALPDVEIEVLGPPPTSGTRDAFVELAMREGAVTFPMLAALEEEDENAFRGVSDAMREDGYFIEAGENDNLIIQKLQANPAALGIFGFSFLEQNGDAVQGALINGVEPTFENIAGGDYLVSRSLFFYVKNAHANVVPGIREFVREFVSDQAAGPDGYLLDKGLIPLPNEMRQAVADSSTALEELQL